MKLLRVTLRVHIQQEALLFYTEQLGFTKTADLPYTPGQRWITVSPDQEEIIQIVLQPPEWFSGAEREQHLQYVGHNPAIVFQVEDCQATYNQLSMNGVRFTLPPSPRPYGIETDAVDMDGNTLVFLQLPGSYK
jgi:predicted enzyme related to lactoylglutathione lyase